MSNNKQSSVEWLESIIQHCQRFGTNVEQKDIEEAKAMHKEEMKQTYFDGWHRNIGNRDEDFEQYYNETFGGNNGKTMDN